MNRRQFVLGAVSFIAALQGDHPVSAAETRMTKAVADLRRELEAAARKHRLLSDQPRRPTGKQKIALQTDVGRIERTRLAAARALRNASPAEAGRSLGLKLNDISRSIQDGIATRALPPLMLREAAPRQNETVSAVVTDIVLETLGISDFKDAAIFLIENYGPMRECYRSAVEQYRLGKYRQAAFQLARLPGLFRDPQVITVLAGKYGRAEASSLRRRMLIAIGARAMPALGPVATAALFAIAVYNNWDRLNNARNRA
jgi:hypothetical protein